MMGDLGKLAGAIHRSICRVLDQGERHFERRLYECRLLELELAYGIPIEGETNEAGEPMFDLQVELVPVPEIQTITMQVAHGE